MSPMPTYVLLGVIAVVFMPGFYWLSFTLGRHARSGLLALRLRWLQRSMRKEGGLLACPAQSIYQALYLIESRLGFVLPHKNPGWVHNYRALRDQLEVSLLERKFHC